jgi:hypothetical protein
VDFENRLRPLARVRQKRMAQAAPAGGLLRRRVNRVRPGGIDAGIEVVGVARGLFPGGVLVTESKAEAQQKTTELLDTNAMTLFQPVFEKDGLLAAIDVLQFDDAAGANRIRKARPPAAYRTQPLAGEARGAGRAASQLRGRDRARGAERRTAQHREARAWLERQTRQTHRTSPLTAFRISSNCPRRLLESSQFVAGGL